jgi:hypothetical protein
LPDEPLIMLSALFFISYKANNQSVLTNIGGEKARLVNRVRYRGFGVTSIRWDAPEEVSSRLARSPHHVDSFASRLSSLQR